MEITAVCCYCLLEARRIYLVEGELRFKYIPPRKAALRSLPRLAVVEAMAGEVGRCIPARAACLDAWVSSRTWLISMGIWGLISSLPSTAHLHTTTVRLNTFLLINFKLITTRNCTSSPALGAM